MSNHPLVEHKLETKFFMFRFLFKQGMCHPGGLLHLKF
jgi:hypothetical protein